jgi:shikimate kinase
VALENKNIVLVGFMGTGKTTVGQALAQQRGLSFVDLDDAIVAAAGKSIPEIFSEEGEEAFRAQERAVVLAAAAKTGQVISCGGGIVKDSANIAALEATGDLVCLTASAKTILERVGADTNRPLLAGGDRLTRIQALLLERAPFYDKIDRQVATDGLTPEQIAAAVIAAIEA